MRYPSRSEQGLSPLGGFRAGLNPKACKKSFWPSFFEGIREKLTFSFGHRIRHFPVQALPQRMRVRGSYQREEQP